MRGSYRVVDPSGLHARPAAQFVKAMNAAGVQGRISKGSRTADVRSILEILGLGIDAGDIVELDLATDAMEVLAQLREILDPIHAGDDV